MSRGYSMASYCRCGPFFKCMCGKPKRRDPLNDPYVSEQEKIRISVRRAENRMNSRRKELERVVDQEKQEKQKLEKQVEGLQQQLTALQSVVKQLSHQEDLRTQDARRERDRRARERTEMEDYYD